MADKKETDEKVVITKKDQDQLIDLLETYKQAILGHEERLQVLEQAVATIHTAIVGNRKLVVPRMDIPKGK